HHKLLALQERSEIEACDRVLDDFSLIKGDSAVESTRQTFLQKMHERRLFASKFNQIKRLDDLHSFYKQELKPILNAIPTPDHPFPYHAPKPNVDKLFNQFGTAVVHRSLANLKEKNELVVSEIATVIVLKAQKQNIKDIAKFTNN